MQQSSSLPEQNAQIDATPKLLKTIQQLQAELWLESSLNQIQSRFSDCLLTASATLPQATTKEAEICQTLVDELHQALNGDEVAIALFPSQSAIGKISYVCSSVHSQSLESVDTTTGNAPEWQLEQEILLEDLQQIETEQPPKVWQLMEDATSGVRGWLLVGTVNLTANSDSLNPGQTQLVTQLITKTIQHFNTALTQLRQIQSWQQRFQELANFNQELERTNQLKNQFLANTSHEIRTPLSSIIGFTHLLLAQGYNPGKQRQQEYLNIIQSSGKHLLALINDILDLSKIEANQLEVQWEVIDVPPLCQNVLALVKEKAANKGLKLRLELDSDVKTIVADPLRLKQMLLNLLFNAVKFTSQGSVGLSVKTQDVNLWFTVWDTGIGISKENQALLFKPYCQIVNSAAPRDEGTGLGLVVTKKLAEIHNGTLEVESELNQGSRFTIILPLKPQAEVLAAIEVKNAEDLIANPEATISKTPAPGESVNTAIEILLVEDDIPNAELIRSALGELGYRVTWVRSGDDMWSTLAQVKPAVILMDVSLPDANGLKLVQQLRENPQYQDIPIIAQTAMAMKGDRETCLAAGVDDYISKPIELPLLATMVAKYSQKVDEG
ncbi:MAG TPA: hybrid histidine kinase/response regulator HrmK [Nostocaceae cyanobacterium]|nr:hybrid histidine kinase/response regulator HrmK [Nostocaceae cyanobacterium]